MDLTNSIKNVPNDQYIACCYLVDDTIRYVATSKDSLYYLYYVDNSSLLENIKESDNDYSFDYFVLNSCKPVLKQVCEFVDSDRIVKVTTVNKDFRFRKPRQRSDKEIITHYNNHNKLF